MDFSTDDKHLATLDVLREARDYLARLPPHPMTRDMIAKIDAHMTEPTQRVLLKCERVFSGTYYTPAGIPIISAELIGRQLRVWRQHARTEFETEKIGNTIKHEVLNGGITLSLQPVDYRDGRR